MTLLKVMRLVKVSDIQGPRVFEFVNDGGLEVSKICKTDLLAKMKK